MINIENTQVITYGQNQTVTIYRDYSDANTWYIVPEPVIPLNDAGLPEFALVQYNGDDGKVSGTCSFQTELAVSPEALAAVKNKLGAGITIGQFDWQSVHVIFTFATAEIANMQLTATPSMYGANRASFIIHLPDQATVNDFVNAFSPGGSAAGTFMLEYDVTALTTLPPATVTVTFNSNTAYQYQRTVDETKNVWGDVTSRTVTIHENLAQSEAGTIAIGPGNLDPALKQKLQDWGNATLENDVNQAVAQAMEIIGSNNADSFSMASVASFTNEYVEGQIVPWIITPRAPIPAFSSQQWQQVYSTVPNQSLAISFTVQNLKDNGVESITLVVTYPTQQTANTYQFTPDKAGTWIFKAPGNVVNGKYAPSYTYQYTVNYTAGGAPYKSPVLMSSDTAIYIDADDLNVLKITFNAANVFSNTVSKTAGGTQNQVDYVLIDFFFVNEADGTPFQSQQGRLDSSNLSATFTSRTKLPYQNPFQYQLTYVLTSGQQVVIKWQTSTMGTKAGGKAKVPVVTLNTPFQTRTITVFPIGSYDMIELEATYSDAVNNLNEQNTWQVQAQQPPEPWKFLAPTNQNSQVIEFSGEYVISETQYEIQSAKTSHLFINVSATQGTFSVEIDPSQIEWDQGPIIQVVVNIYTKTGTNGQKTNIGLVPAFHKANTDSFLYSFLFATSTTPTCYYTAEYWIQGRARPNIIPETAIEGEDILVLPGVAPAEA